jgi:hypothetical protein
MKTLQEHLLNESEWTDGGREYAWSPRAKYIQISTMYEKTYLFLTDGDIEQCFEDECEDIKRLRPGEIFDPEYGDETIIIRFK